MTGPTVILSGQTRRLQAHQLVERAPVGSVVSFEPPRRSLPQNSRLHAMITDISRQVEWPPGSKTKRTVEAWKDIFTAALRSANHGLDVVPGLNGGFVLLGMHTSRMSVAEVNELMTMIEAWCAQNGVELRDPDAPAAVTPSTLECQKESA
jgi:hypothetical protein